MRKIAVAICALGLASPALADHPRIIDELRGIEFGSRGECESAIKKARNERRKAGAEHTNSPHSGSDYNKFVREERSCARNPNGSWSVR